MGHVSLERGVKAVVVGKGETKEVEDKTLVIGELKSIPVE